MVSAKLARLLRERSAGAIRPGDELVVVVKYLRAGMVSNVVLGELTGQFAGANAVNATAEWIQSTVASKATEDGAEAVREKSFRKRAPKGSMADIVARVGKNFPQGALLVLCRDRLVVLRVGGFWRVRYRPIIECEYGSVTSMRRSSWAVLYHKLHIAFSDESSTKLSVPRFQAASRHIIEEWQQRSKFIG
jgi:hypothetical protein